MSNNETFESSIRLKGDLAGVLECDDDAGHFYLCRVNGEQPAEVLSSIQISRGCPEFSQEDVDIRWDVDEVRVGLFIERSLWAVIDCDTKRAVGCIYQRSLQPPEIPFAPSNGRSGS